MLKRTITYTDYLGNQRTEDFYFNLTQAEVMEMELSRTGGLTAMIEKIVAEQDHPKIIKIFKELVLKAYGQVSPDGRKFVKNDELRDDFSQTEAYSMLFIELATNAKAAAEFVNGIVPATEAKTEQPKLAPVNN